MKVYVPLGDRVAIATAAMEFAHLYSRKPQQFYYEMVEAVSEEPERKEDGGE